MLAFPFLIGILACRGENHLPFNDADFYKLLIRHARRLGMEAFVFTPEGLASDRLSIQGYVLTEEQQWSQESVPLPSLIYDRFFSADRIHRNGYHSLMNIMAQSEPKPLILGNRLMGKWAVHHSLARDEQLRPLLPFTCKFKKAEQLLDWLKNDRRIVAKPDSGTHGKGIMLICKKDQGYEVSGRDRLNQTFSHRLSSDRSLLDWINHTLDQQYLLQSFLNLTNTDGEVFDIRSLVQKNGKGVWSHTGLAVRLGEHGSLTANLHGGGQAVAAEGFLSRQFGVAKALQLISQLEKITIRVAETLEHYYGRLAELGIDFGIDQQARLWIIEANSKPGRAVFRSIDNKRARWLSLHQPMAYAKYLLQNRNGWRNQAIGADPQPFLASLG